MIGLNDFSKNFKDLAVPHELVELLNFEWTTGKDDFYSEGFELRVIEEKHLLKTYSDKGEFLNSIIEFAQADGTGSSYAFWLKNGNKDLRSAPIVVFGSEGGYHIVAKNILELFQILTYDIEPIILWDQIFYHKDADYVPSEKNDAFKKWALQNFKISEVNSADDIVKAAQIEYQDQFKTWMKNYYTE
jgi:hypothetical protein